MLPNFGENIPLKKLPFGVHSESPSQQHFVPLAELS